MTDVELDATVTALEENHGGSVQKSKYISFQACFNLENKVPVRRNNLNIYKIYISDTIAFHTVLTSYDTITENSAVLFNEILLNEGDG